MKKEARILGIDDASFDKHKDKEVLVIGTMYRGGDFMDGLVSCWVTKDGNDSTEKISEMINKSKFKPQLQLIMLDGIAVGGFNVVDLKELSIKTGLPVINVIRNYPDYKKIFSALKKIGQEEKIKLIEKAGEVHKVNDIYVQLTGISLEDAKEFLRISCVRGNYPEPIRIAHLIGSGIIAGESHGRA
ncbi:DUF99 family protein [Candidatus Woesearchaeota archaeon]|nr:MAG: DUF99 family protein [Candidatus Woesearchaeota archaeon]